MQTSSTHLGWAKRQPQTADRYECIGCGIRMGSGAELRYRCPFCGWDGLEYTEGGITLTPKEVRALIGHIR